ncbi:MAG: S8 family serine peptidase [Candidatus Thermoplasmatota archaeon]
MEIAWSRNRVIVAASGNDGRNGYVSHPASFPNVIAVGSIGSTSSRSYFSNGGPQLDLMAPGESVISTVPTTSIMCGVRLDPYCSVSGTSMATPHVAGVAALVFSLCPSWTNAQVVNRLFNTADDLGSAGWDQSYGWGRVDAYDAVRLGC